LLASTRNLESAQRRNERADHPLPGVSTPIVRAPSEAKSKDSDSPVEDACLVRIPCLELALLDPQIGREAGVVAVHVLDEALGVLAPDEHLHRLAERVLGA
jgi:hypothetical protein